MAFRRREAGAWVNPSTNMEKRSGNAWAPIDLVRKRTATGWEIVWARITLANATHTVLTQAPARGTFSFNSDGTITKTGGTAGSLPNWLNSGTSSGYEIRATITSTVDTGMGQSNVGNFGVWLALTSNQEFGAQVDNTNSSRELTFTVEIRRASSGVVLASASYVASIQTAV